MDSPLAMWEARTGKPYSPPIAGYIWHAAQGRAYSGPPIISNDALFSGYSRFWVKSSVVFPGTGRFFIFSLVFLQLFVILLWFYFFVCSFDFLFAFFLLKRAI
jgi:hypothetical protein